MIQQVPPGLYIESKAKCTTEDDCPEPDCSEQKLNTYNAVILFLNGDEFQKWLGSGIAGSCQIEGQYMDRAWNSDFGKKSVCASIVQVLKTMLSERNITHPAGTTPLKNVLMLLIGDVDNNSKVDFPIARFCALLRQYYFDAQLGNASTPPIIKNAELSYWSPEGLTDHFEFVSPKVNP